MRTAPHPITPNILSALVQKIFSNFLRERRAYAEARDLLANWDADRA